ncbi:hypothetical protein LOK49_LG08G01205 [Camellia lanceoleosa]|uniref:Uncharacterized protein n=1 Tax=Camellia lanceoleosa TaxID=1840588 RepID=A0ACC0GQV1_9ERIC|nr:hypothetical protein LOK49_LG08G01205 [Camellia lanceoleosa]
MPDAVLAFQPRRFHASEEPTAVRQKPCVDRAPWRPPSIVPSLLARTVGRTIWATPSV